MVSVLAQIELQLNEFPGTIQFDWTKICILNFFQRFVFGLKTMQLKNAKINFNAFMPSVHLNLIKNFNTCYFSVSIKPKATEASKIVPSNHLIIICFDFFVEKFQVSHQLPIKPNHYSCMFTFLIFDSAWQF